VTDTSPHKDATINLPCKTTAATTSYLAPHACPQYPIVSSYRIAIPLTLSVPLMSCPWAMQLSIMQFRLERSSLVTKTLFGSLRVNVRYSIPVLTYVHWARAILHERMKKSRIKRILLSLFIIYAHLL